MPNSRREAPACPVSALARPATSSTKVRQPTIHGPADAPADIQDCGFGLWKTAVIRPDESGQVHGDHAEYGLQHAHDHGGESDITLRVECVLGQCGHRVKADVRERGDGCAQHQRADAERFRPIKSGAREQPAKTRRIRHPARGQSDEKHRANAHHDHHHGAGARG